MMSGNASDADVANSHQKVASSGGVVMTTGDDISMEIKEATGVGGGRPHRQHSKWARSASYRCTWAPPENISGETSSSSSSDSFGSIGPIFTARLCHSMSSVRPSVCLSDRP